MGDARNGERPVAGICPNGKSLQWEKLATGKARNKHKARNGKACNGKKTCNGQSSLNLSLVSTEQFKLYRLGALDSPTLTSKLESESLKAYQLELQGYFGARNEI